jgi:hypothetical protein
MMKPSHPQRLRRTPFISGPFALLHHATTHAVSVFSRA